MKKMYSRFLALVMALAMIFSCTSVAFATEVPDDCEADSESNQLMSIEEAGISREEAMELLGLTEEDVQNGSFYAVSQEVSPRSTITVTAGAEPLQETTTRSSTGWGANMYVMGGKYFTWGAVLRNISNGYANVSVNLCYADSYPNDPKVNSSILLSSTSTSGQHHAQKVSTVGSQFRFYYNFTGSATATIVIVLYSANS